MIVKREGKNGNKYHDIVAESFLSDMKERKISQFQMIMHFHILQH
jgi:hypothetical protein